MNPFLKNVKPREGRCSDWIESAVEKNGRVEIKIKGDSDVQLLYAIRVTQKEFWL